MTNKKQEDPKATFAKNLQRYMKAHNIDRQELCKIMNVPYMTVSDWVNGKTFPRIDKIQRLAAYFRISKSDLIENKDYDNPKAQDEVWEIRAALQRRPELKILFNMSKDATKEDIEKAIAILDMLKR